jgi:phage tail sheath protein FI
VRRLLLMIEKALEQSSYWAVFEPNNLVTRQLLRFSIGEFLETLRRQGALAGDTPEAAYRVRCDETNNPPDAVDAGQLVVDVAVAPAIPFEFIRFRLGRTVEAVAITE